MRIGYCYGKLFMLEKSQFCKEENHGINNDLVIIALVMLREVGRFTFMFKTRRFNLRQ